MSHQPTDLQLLLQADRQITALTEQLGLALSRAAESERALAEAKEYAAACERTAALNQRENVELKLAHEQTRTELLDVIRERDVARIDRAETRAELERVRERVNTEESARCESETLMQQTGSRLSKLQDTAAAACCMWESTENHSLHEIRMAMRALRAVSATAVRRLQQRLVADLARLNSDLAVERERVLTAQAQVRQLEAALDEARFGPPETPESELATYADLLTDARNAHRATESALASARNRVQAVIDELLAIEQKGPDEVVYAEYLRGELQQALSTPTPAPSEPEEKP